MKIRQELAQLHPNAHEPYVAIALNNLGVLYYEINQYEKSEQYLNDTLVLYKKLAQFDAATYEPDVAMTLGNLAELNLVMDYRKPQALAHAQESLQRYQQLAHRNPKAYQPHVERMKTLLTQIQENK